MPTISQLPPAMSVDPADAIPISQGGVARAAAIGTLLAQTQPAIIVESPSLLGRSSLGAGGPEQVDVGSGLALNAGTLMADGADHGGFPIQASLLAGDQVVLNRSGVPGLLDARSLRGIFSAGSNISIDATGVIAATTPGMPATDFDLSSLPTIAAMTPNDLIGVTQGGTAYAASYASLINGQTIGMAPAADAAQDVDTLWVGQDGDELRRQTLGAIWSWIARKLPMVRAPATELASDITLDPALHSGQVLVCAAPITITCPVTALGIGFCCDIINLSAGDVGLAGTVTTSTGSGTIPAGQAATLRSFTRGGSVVLYARVSTPPVAVVAPGQVTGMAGSAATPTSISLSWRAPTSGGAVTSYSVQYRVSGTTTWTTAVQGYTATDYTIVNLSADIAYDFAVTAANIAGAGPQSAILTLSTAGTVLPPGQPGSLTATSASSSGITLTWTAPASGGTISSYTAMYRVSGTTSWSGTVVGINGTSTLIGGLSPATSYDFKIYATNSAGAGPVTPVATAATSASVGDVTAITWNLVPTGTYAHGSGAIGLNAHVEPATAAIQFGFSSSATTQPASWTVAISINTDLWGAYVPTPATAGMWYAWASGTDGSAPTVFPTPFTVT